MRRLPVLVLPVLLTLAVAPSPAAAQDTPFPSYERTEQDLGTWDAVLVGRDGTGRIVSSRGVEINTRGCDGRCITTRGEGGLAPNRNVPRQRAWWETYDGMANRAGIVDQRTALAQSPYGVDAMAPSATGFLPERASKVVSYVPGSRTSVEYPAEGRRMVTIFRQQPNGAEVMVLRITYTRRN